MSLEKEKLATPACSAGADLAGATSSQWLTTSILATRCVAFASIAFGYPLAIQMQLSGALPLKPLAKIVVLR